MCSLMYEMFRRTVLWDSDVKQLLQAQQLRNILESGFFLLKGKLGTRYYVEWSAQCRRVLCSLSLLHVMHGLISTYNYLISSCAYPRWAWHKFKYGCTNLE